MSGMEQPRKSKASNAIRGGIKNTGRALAFASAIGAFAQDVKAEEGKLDMSTTAIILRSLAADKISKSPEQFLAREKSAVSDNVAVDVALLAHAYQPNFSSFDEDKNLADVGKVRGELVLPLVMHKKVGEKYWQQLQQEFELADVKLIKYQKETTKTADVKRSILEELSRQYGEIDPVELEQSRVMVARNLSMKGDEVTDATVKAEVTSILKRRAEIGGQHIFRNDVLLASADEVQGSNGYSPGSPQFGQKALRDGLRAAVPSSRTLNYWNPFVSDSAPYQSTPESIAEAKAEIKKVITTSIKNPLTVFFDGHGNSDSFGLSMHRDPQTGEMVGGPDDSISVSELAEWLTQRYQAEPKVGHTDDLQTSFVFSACYMQNFARSLAAVLQERHVPLPRLMISASEYGQYGFSNLDNPFGSQFNEMLVKSTDLKTLMENKSDIRGSAPTMLVPREENPNILQQISGLGLVPASSAVG